ncbi:hypothetical protein BV898_19731, partial [Hypsibius exemplaris]
ESAYIGPVRSTRFGSREGSVNRFGPTVPVNGFGATGPDITSEVN